MPLKRIIPFLLLFFFSIGLAAQDEDEWGNGSSNSWDDGEWDDWKEDIGYSDTVHSLTHWAGIDIAVTGYMTSGNRLNMPKGLENWELDYGRSIGWSLNLLEKRFALADRYLGLVTGIGFDWDRYAFEKNVSLRANSDSTWSMKDGTDYDESKLKVTYLRVPLLFELNTSRIPDNSFHLSVGAIGSWRIHSKFEQEYSKDGTDFTSEKKARFNLNSFRYSLTTRLGYSNYNIFFEYSPMPLFQRGEGPEFYPFNVGVTVLGM